MSKHSSLAEVWGLAVRELSTKNIPVNSKVFSPPTAIGSQTEPKLMSRVHNRGLSDANLDLVGLGPIFNVLLVDYVAALIKIPKK